MCIVTTQVVKDDVDVVRNYVLKVALLVSGASVVPGVVTVVNHLLSHSSKFPDRCGTELPH